MIALSVLTAAVCLAEPSARLRSTEFEAGLTGVGMAYSFRGGSFGDFTFGPSVRGQALLGGGFTLDGAYLLSVPADAQGVSTSNSLTLRAGYTGEWFQIVVGAVGQYAPEARPTTQFLPSVRAELAFTPRLRFSASLFEHYGVVPVELAWVQDRFYLGYLPPFGGSFGLRVPFGDELSLSLRAAAYKLFDSEVAMIGLAGTIGGER